MTHDDDRVREKLRLMPKGERMPENRVQFEYLAKRYEKGLLDAQEENGRLRALTNDLQQMITNEGLRSRKQLKARIKELESKLAEFGWESLQ